MPPESAPPRGDDLLIVGPSGCGKSTLTIGLIRVGGKFLSDDAILLRAAPDAIEALTFRRPFSVDVARVANYPDLLPCLAPSSEGFMRKRRADACVRIHTSTSRVFVHAPSSSRESSRNRRVCSGTLYGPWLFTRC